MEIFKYKQTWDFAVLLNSALFPVPSAHPAPVCGALQLMGGSRWVLVVQNRADCASSGAESEDRTISSTPKPFCIIN